MADFDGAPLVNDVEYKSGRKKSGMQYNPLVDPDEGGCRALGKDVESCMQDDKLSALFVVVLVSVVNEVLALLEEAARGLLLSSD